MATEKLNRPSTTIYERHPGLEEIKILPLSILIIPDGSDRSATENGLSIAEGHKKTGQMLKKMLLAFAELKGVETLMAWGSSCDNYDGRSKEELDEIMLTMETIVKGARGIFQKYEIRFIRLGREDRIRENYPSLWKVIRETEIKTQNYKNKKFALLLDFSGEDHELRFAERIQMLPPGTGITLDVLKRLRDGGGLIEPAELIIRTGEEQEDLFHISDLGWLARNAEFYPVSKFSPDFTEEDLVGALVAFSQRERRLGGRPEK